jgi:beta-N-acetylhexosaminidase
MTVKDLDIGQLFVIGFSGCRAEADHPVVADISAGGLGGVILFDRNIDGSIQNIAGLEQLTGLCTELQQHASIPLLITVDQEGGRVGRLKERDGFPATRSAAQLGRDDETVQTAARAAEVAAILKQCGINCNLAPVVDLNCNPENPVIGRYERSFGRDPDIVVRHARQWIEAHRACGVASCLKHFPGHGSSSSDSHLGFVDVTQSWEPEELEPYQRLIKGDLVDCVMTAHVVQRHLDSEGRPATLSWPIISGILRGQLGFDGVVMSDDLQMEAIRSRWSYEQAVQEALLAGVDILVIGNNLQREERLLQRGKNAVRELLHSGRLSERQLEKSLGRIGRLKQRINGEIPWNKRATTAF